MNSTLIAGAGVAALFVLAACAPPHPGGGGSVHAGRAMRTIVRLDCPERQGELVRQSMAPDGSACAYADPAGSQVSLRLVNLDGKSPAEVLAPIETALAAEIPPNKPPAATDVARAGGDKDKVDIDLPGIHVHADDNGAAKVDAAGVHVDAAGAGGKATVTTGAPGKGVSVQADDSGAQVRVNEPGDGVRLNYFLVSQAPGPHGFKVAGYEARGPAGGPLAVATVLARDEDHDDLHDALRALIKRNVGG